ncbi:protein of unknown function [Hyphomicrobium sp. MC1]|nr:protein of unknown function [Hyphomicrobium sp. MC1]
MRSRSGMRKAGAGRGRRSTGRLAGLVKAGGTGQHGRAQLSRSQRRGKQAVVQAIPAKALKRPNYLRCK